MNDENRRAEILHRICQNHSSLQVAMDWSVDSVADLLSAEALHAFRAFDYEDSLDLAKGWIEDVFQKEVQPPQVAGWNFGIIDYNEEHPLYGMYIAGYERIGFEGGLVVAEYGWLPDRRIIYAADFFQEISHYCSHLEDGTGLFLCKAYAVSLAVNLGDTLASSIRFDFDDYCPFTVAVDGLDEILYIGNLTPAGMGPGSLKSLQ